MLKWYICKGRRKLRFGLSIYVYGYIFNVFINVFFDLLLLFSILLCYKEKSILDIFLNYEIFIFYSINFDLYIFKI